MQENSLVHDTTEADARNMADFFRSLAERENPPVLELLDINKKPVGAIYLSVFSAKKLAVQPTTNSEKYYLFADGIGIYFSFWRTI